ncbi:MAG: Maf family protein, partial [Bacteroidaceae bacterium]|nr:Maf family protein [Bacteroidaceae bacterium]
MLENISQYHILLASNSPRRRELLGGLGVEYEVVSLPEIDESYPPTLQGVEIPTYIAARKAEAYSQWMKDDTLLITADTIVWLDGKVYGKPADAQDACKMLRELSGKTHTVITGMALTTC